MSQMTSTARVGARALQRPETSTPRLRVVTGAPLRRSGATFGIVCAILLAAGLVALLVLNTALAQGSFTLQKLQSTSDQLSDTQGGLNESLDVSRSPANLATRALGMGMVPAGSAAFLRLSDGKVIGVAKPAPRGSGFTVVGGTTVKAPAASAVKRVKVAPVPAAVKPTKVAPAPAAAKPAKAPASETKPARPAKR